MTESGTLTKIVINPRLHNYRFSVCGAIPASLIAKVSRIHAVSIQGGDTNTKAEVAKEPLRHINPSAAQEQ